MRNILSFIFGVMLVATLPACAAHRGNPAPLSAGPFPTTQIIAFGDKTLFGFGGSPMQYTNQAALGVSRWLKITAQVNNASVSGTYFGIDDRNMLVPCATITSNVCSSTYGGAATRSATPYTVTVAEYSNSGRTIPTGNQSVITVNTTANVYTIREMTSLADGCVNPITGTAVNCEVTNPDASNTFQLAVVLGLALNKTTDSVTARDGWFNPNSLVWRLIPTITNYTGSGTIVVSSETKDIGTLDSYGNPNLKSGFKFGGTMFQATTSGNVNYPILFDYIWFTRNTLSPQIPYFLWQNNTDGTGVAFTHNRWTQACALLSVQSFTQLHPEQSFLNNTFDNCPAAASGGGQVGSLMIFADGSDCATACYALSGITAKDNAFENPTDDVMQISTCNNDIERNYVFGGREPSPGHLDSMQHGGVVDGSTTQCPFGTLFGNLVTNGPANANGDGGPQGTPFLHFQIGPINNGRFSSYTGTNNINSMVSDGNCTYLENTNNITASNNINLTTPQTVTPGPQACSMVVICSPEFDHSGGCPPGTANSTNGVFDSNENNLFDISLMSGSVTNTNNHTIAWANNSTGCSAIRAVYANYVCGDDPLNTNRGYGLSMFYISSRTATKNVDNTFWGAIWPTMDDGSHCWAKSGVVPNFALSCAANGTTTVQ